MIEYIDLGRHNKAGFCHMIMFIHRNHRGVKRVAHYNGKTNHRAARMLNLFLEYLRKCGDYPK